MCVAHTVCISCNYSSVCYLGIKRLLNDLGLGSELTEMFGDILD